MNKRAWIAITAVIFIGITMSLIIFAYYKPYTESEEMGGQQAAILEAYSLGEQARRYSSRAAYLAGQQALYDLGQRGGYYSNSTCGSSGGYAIWEGACIPSRDKLKENLKDFFDEEFHKYLSEFELDGYGKVLEHVEYDRKITVEEDKIVIEGIPKTEEITYFEDEVGKTKTVESAIKLSSEEHMFEYTLSSYFIIKLDVDLDEIFKMDNAKKVSSSDLYDYYEYDTGKKLLVKTDEETLIVRFAREKTTN